MHSDLEMRLTKPQIFFLLHIGFLLVLPLLGTTVFNMAKQIIEYIQYGRYNTDCLAYVTGPFNSTSFDFCYSEQIIPLVIGFMISTTMFSFMSYRVYRFITERKKQ